MLTTSSPLAMTISTPASPAICAAAILVVIPPVPKDVSAPLAQAQSRSSVTYQVTVTLEGDVSSLDSNLTACVYFGMSDEMMQEMQNMPQDGIELEGIRGVPETEGRPQTGDNVPSGNGRKEDGQ